MKDKILIFGKGFIGDRILENFNCDVSLKRVNLFQDAQDEIAKYKPDIIINCIGFTGTNNVDGCELDKDKTLQANTFVPIILAEAALRNNIKLVHISSGCIYHYDYAKDKPIDEERMPDFFGLLYSRSKIYTERMLEVLSGQANILTIRIRIPLDVRPHQRNILTKLIHYKKVIDIPNSVTYIPDFIKALKYLIEIDAKGIYNVVNEGGLRYPELLEVYKKYVPDYFYEIVNLNLVLKAPRTNLILSTDKLKKAGFKVRKISEVLEECVQDYVKS